MTPKEEFILERNPDYWQGPSPWARVVRKEIPNDAARVAQLKAGQVDLIVRAPATDVPVRWSATASSPLRRAKRV